MRLEKTFAGLSPEDDDGDSLLVLRLSLNENKDDVWRLLEVPASTRLTVLHDQILMPSCGFARGYHGYVFVSDGCVFGPPSNAGYIDMMHLGMHYFYLAPDSNVSIGSLFASSKKKEITRTYDLGDSWTWTLSLEAQNKKKTPRVSLVSRRPRRLPARGLQRPRGHGRLRLRKVPRRLQT